jgi:hypothetical protein
LSRKNNNQDQQGKTWTITENRQETGEENKHRIPVKENRQKQGPLIPGEEMTMIPHVKNGLLLQDDPLHPGKEMIMKYHGKNDLIPRLPNGERLIHGLLSRKENPVSAMNPKVT